MANEANGTAATPMGIDGPVSRTQGIGMGVPFKGLLDEAPADAPELDFEGLDSDEGSDEHDDTEGSEGDSDGGPHGARSDDEGDDSDEEGGKERRREANDSKSKLISKLRARDRDLQQLRRSERAKDRELTQLRESAKAGGKSAIDRRDPGGSIVRMLKETLGSKDMSDKALNQLVKEHLTDALIDVQPELVEKDNNLRTRREKRLAEMALAEERAELRRMADEAKAERERLIRESEAAQHDDHARSEVKRFLEAEVERFPYLGVIPTAAEDLYEVLEEMAATGEHDFGPGPGQAKRVAEGFRLGAKRLNEYHKRQAEIYGKVRGKPADEKATGKITSPGKNAAVRGQNAERTRKAASGVGPRAIASRDDEPDPRLKFTEFVEQQQQQQERERRRSTRGR